MKHSSLLTKAAALTSSVLLVATFVATRCHCFDYRQPADIDLTDSSDAVVTRPFSLQFQIVAESDASFYFDSNLAGELSKNHDWIARVDHARRDPSLIEVTTAELRSWAAELRARVPENNAPVVMSGSKSAIIISNVPSKPLFAGLPTSQEVPGNSSADHTPIAMFPDDTNPLPPMLSFSHRLVFDEFASTGDTE